MEKFAKLHFVVEREDRQYEFIAPAGAPFGEAHDALYEFVKEVLVMAKNRSEQMEKKEDDSNKDHVEG